MTQVMDGIRILEVAEYAMVPAAAAVLADWGADVIKVEHAERGDSVRGLAAVRLPNGKRCYPSKKANGPWCNK